MTRPPIDIPPALLGYPDRGQAWAPWLASLPRLVDQALAGWSLAADGPATHGYCSLVLPVRTDDGRPAVLKVGWPHDEAEHEHLALQHWHGDGAVELLRADPRRQLLLLERAGSDDVASLPIRESVTVVAGFYRRLHRPAMPQLRLLSGHVARRTDALAALGRDAPLPRRLVEQAISLGRDLLATTGIDGTLIHGDLHFANVLSAEREPWLVIDPKPISGDPHYEVAPLLWNRWDEAVASGDVREAVRDRLWTAVEVGGLDPDRARDWVVVREMHNALFCLADAERRGAGLSAGDREELTRAVAIAKAVQD